MTVYTPDIVIAKYVEMRDARDVMSKRHAEEMAPLNKGLEMMEAWLLNFLNETKQESARTDHGTAYKNTATSATVEDWPTLLWHILEKPLMRVVDAMETGATLRDLKGVLLTSSSLELLNRAVNKTAVKEILEAGGPLPPGVKFTAFTKVGVRRT